MTESPALVKIGRKKRFDGLFCSAPYEYAHVDYDGNVFVCCPAWLPEPVGSVSEASFDEVWNSPAAQAIRESILDGSYKYCDAAGCPHLTSDTGRLQKLDEVTDPFYERVIAEGITTSPGPKTIQLAYDLTCNLACPSCRCELIVARGEDYEKAKRIHDKIVSEALGDVDRLEVSGQGDPFSSRLYLNFMRDFDQEKYPNLRMYLTTNGLLLTPRTWELIKNSHGAIEGVHVSLNGATPETFAINQERGDLNVLLKNLAFIKELHDSGTIPRFTLGFYVQQNNWREMKEAVGIAKQFGAKCIVFSHMFNWGTFSESEYLSFAIHLEDHPDHEAFKEYLNDPIFLDPVVYLGNIATHLPEGFFESEAVVVEPVDRNIRIEWSDLVSELGLEEPAADRVLEVVNSQKDSYAAICLRPPTVEGPAPLEYFANRVAARTTGDRLEEERKQEIFMTAREEFLDYSARAREPEERQSYLNAISSMNREKWLEFVDLLNPEQTQAMERLGLGGLFGITTGYDPFAEKVAELLRAQG